MNYDPERQQLIRLSDELIAVLEASEAKLWIQAMAALVAAGIAARANNMPIGVAGALLYDFYTNGKPPRNPPAFSPPPGTLKH